MTRKLFLATVIVSQTLVMSSQSKAAQHYEFTGHVIAKDPYAGLARVSSAINGQLLIVKVDEPTKQTKDAQFIKVQYEDYAGQRPLPGEMLEGKSDWRFLLTRERSCDQQVSQGLIVTAINSTVPPKAGTFVLNESAGHDIPAVKTALRCFILRPGGLKPVTSAQRKEQAKEQKSE